MAIRIAVSGNLLGVRLIFCALLSMFHAAIQSQCLNEEPILEDIWRTKKKYVPFDKTCTARRCLFKAKI